MKTGYRHRTTLIAIAPVAAASALLLVSPAASGADDTKAQVLKEAAKLPEVGQQDAVGAQTRTNGERPDSGVKVPSKDTARPAAPEDKADHGARKNDRPDVPGNRDSGDHAYGQKDRPYLGEGSKDEDGGLKPEDRAYLGEGSKDDDGPPNVRPKTGTLQR